MLRRDVVGPRHMTKTKEGITSHWDAEEERATGEAPVNSSRCPD